MRTKLHSVVLVFFLLVLANSVKAQPGNTLNFDGTNDGVSIPSVAGFGVSKVTIETWIYWTPTANTDVQFICSKGLSAGTEVLEIHTGGTANALRFLPRPNVYIDVTNALPVNRWTHIAYVHDPSTSFLKIYINGVETSYTVTLGSISTALTTNSNPFTIGKRSSNEYYFKGTIDEFRFWNVTRTQAEIQANMFNTISPSSTGLFAYYNFDAGTAGGTNTGLTTLADQTSNANNGTLGGPFALTGATSNWVESYAMVVPTATAATNAYTTSLTANWTAPAVGTVTNYLLDVSTSSTFASFVSGYNGLSVSGTTKIVTGLTASTTYYYRVRADKTSVTGQGSYSNVITTPTTTTPLPPGNALNFDGSNDGVSIPSVVGFGVSKATIETWVYWTPTANTDVQFICSKGLGAGTEVLEIHTGITANGLRFLPRPNVYIDVTNALPVNRWTHISYVHDPSTSYLKIYINGVEKSYTVTLGSISTALTTSSNAFSIGKRSSNEYYFKGSVDEFRFWNVVRTQAEIQANMFNTVSPSSTGLFAYYNFDAGTAGGINTGLTTLSDQTANANNGTLGGSFALTGATSNWIASTAWNTWTGTTSNSFATATNWQLGTVPTTVDNILIPTGASNLPVSITGTQAVNMASIQASASATVTGTLQIAAPIYNSGTLTATSGTIELNGTSAQTIAASTFAGNTVQNLTVNNAAGVTLGGELNITGTLTPTLGTLSTGGFLTLKSNASATARIANSAGTISGNVTQERFIPAKATRRFSFITSPVSQALNAAWQQQIHITGAGTGGTPCPSLTAHSNGFDASTTNAPNLFSYNASAASGSRWTANTIGTTVFTLTPGTGYRLNVRGARSIGCSLLDGTVGGLVPTAVTLSATGAVNNASKNAGSFSNTYNNNLANNWVLMGNPYPSEIDFSAFRTANSGVISASYIIYDPANAPDAVTPANMYSLWNAGTWSNAPLGAPTSITNANGQYIASGQAFFVQAINNTNITLNFTEAHKYAGTQNGVFRTARTWNDILRIALNKDAIVIDQTVIRYANEAGLSNNRLGDLDATLLSSSNSYLGTIKAGSLTSIQTRSLQNVNTDTVALDFNCSQTGNYSFNFSEHNNFTAANIYLLDKYTNTTTEVKANPVYSFSVDKANAATQTNRFVLVFNKAIVPVVTTITGIKMYPNPANKNLTVELPITEGKYTVRITDVTGKQVYQNQLAGGVQAINISKLAQGNYVVEITDTKGNRAVEKLVKQ